MDSTVKAGSIFILLRKIRWVMNTYLITLTNVYICTKKPARQCLAGPIPFSSSENSKWFLFNSNLELLSD